MLTYYRVRSAFKPARALPSSKIYGILNQFVYYKRLLPFLMHYRSLDFRVKKNHLLVDKVYGILKRSI
jgi:hypothetical protein